ncbi:MAG: hypothetical protein WCH34_12510 [Bacteroidota bacterium]
MNLKFLIITYFIFNSFVLMAQTDSSRQSQPCNKEIVAKRVKELIYEYVNNDNPGIINPDLTFKKHSGAVINEFLNDSLRSKIAKEIGIEFKDCLLNPEVSQSFSDSKNKLDSSNIIVPKDSVLTPKDTVVKVPAIKYSVLVVELSYYFKFSTSEIPDFKACKGNDGMYRYYSGEFISQSDAEQHKKYLSHLGLKDVSVEIMQGQEVK